MKSIVRMICMRIVGIAFSVLGAIVLALVWLNMGSILGMINGTPYHNRAQSNVGSIADASSGSQTFEKGFSSRVSRVTNDGTGNLAHNKADVDDAAKKINSLEEKMNDLIHKNQDTSYSHWPISDQKKYQSLENQKKVAINEYNSAAIRVNKSSSDMQSDIIGLLKSLIPSSK